MRSPLFFSPGQACSSYATYRDSDHPKLFEARAFIEGLWNSVGEYVDADLPEKAKEDFEARFWELYLAAAILRRGFPLKPRPSPRGPDLCILDPLCFLEAVITRPGEKGKPESVRSPFVDEEEDDDGKVPHEKIILRITNAVDSKHRKYLKYRDIGVLSSSDRYVIAINSSEVPRARFETHIPYLVSAVLPFGDMYVSLDAKTFQSVGLGFEHRSEIKKSSGASVATTFFQDRKSEGITGLLYSFADPINRPPKEGGDFLFIHNPLALNPLPRGTFPFGREYWVPSDQSLEWKDHPVRP